MFGLLLLAATQAQPVPPIILTPFPPVISPPSRVPPPPKGASAAVPLRPIARLFSADDYPESAIVSGQQGEARANVEVAPDGKVSGCRIVESSGSAALDHATCLVIQRRARFLPARNANNEAVTGSWRQKIRWEMASLPFASFERITRVASGPRGRMMACAGSSDCDDADFALDEAWMALAGPPIPPSTDIVFERRFEPGDHAVGTLRPTAMEGGLTRFAGRARISIDYYGKVVGCVSLPGGVGWPHKLCEISADWLFKLGRVRGETRTGVVSLVLRSRTPGGGDGSTTSGVSVER